MADLSVTYMGLKLANPLVVASSSLTNTVDKVRRCEDAGAGAVVLKSLFEEQIEAQTAELEDESWPYSHPEAFEYIRQMGMRIGQDDYLRLVEAARRAVSIPVIASLNCVSPKWWTNYARQIASAGAGGLELNIAVLPRDPGLTADTVERTIGRIVGSLKPGFPVPLAVKIGPYFTSLPRMAGELVRAGADALVLFNRFYQVDIDIERVAPVSAYHFSTPEEASLPLRWMAILHGQVDCDLAASTGVHDAAGVIRQLLAGATVVQAASTFYRNGLERLGEMKQGLADWMERKGYRFLSDFRGKLSQAKSERPEYFERLQYIKALTGVE
jgi:dihydroorotate dehydrogenase (fumarate)